jgi:ankyrin repeat protein
MRRRRQRTRRILNAFALALAAIVLLTQASVAREPDAAAAAALFKAVRSGDVSATRALLPHHRNLNEPLPDGSTLLAWAVESQNGELVRLLLDHGARANGVGTVSVAPLFIACQYGDPAILAALLDAHADVKATRADGIAPLSVCAGNAPANILQRVLAAGAVVDQPDETGQTALMWAAAKGRVDNIKLLVAHGAQVNGKSAKGFTPLFFALKSHVPDAPVTVLEAGADPDYVAPDGTSVVQLAMYQKDYAFAGRMIARRADLGAFDRNGNQLLHAAVLANQPSLVKLLLAKGADANALTGPPKVKMRFEVNFKTGDYDVPPKPALLLAAESGHAPLMQMLVDGGANPQIRLPDGTNVVLAAAASGKLAALRLALQLMPDPNTATKDGDTALHVLLSTGTGSEIAPMMKLLAERGAKTDIRNRTGQTAADLAKEAETDAKLAYESVFGTQRVGKL